MIYVDRSASVAAMTTMGERLRKVREAKYPSAAKAAAALGVSASTYRAHENGQNEFSPEEAERYGRKFGVSAAYLLTGEQGYRGPTLVSSFDPDEDEHESDEPGRSYSRDHWKPKVKGALPELDVKLGAGNGNIGEVINLPVGKDSISGHHVKAEWLFSESFLRHEAKASVNNTIVMEVVGDSMQPSYLPGDRVLVDLAQNQMTVDTVYAISDGMSEPQIKRLQRVPFSDPVQVRIISDNTAFEKDIVELSRLTIIGRVCGHIARK